MTNVICRMTTALQGLAQLQALWLVGSSRATPDGAPARGLDLLAAFVDGGIAEYAAPMMGALEQEGLVGQGRVSDDSLQGTTADGLHWGVAAYHLDDLTQRVRDCVAGRRLDGQHRAWAIGYWLPEGLCGDLARADCLLDRADVHPTLRALVDPYPEGLARALRKVCRSEVEQKLVVLEKVGFRRGEYPIERHLAEADVAAALVRWAFAESRCYLVGFHRLEEQVAALSAEGRRIYELAPSVIAARGDARPDVIAEVRALVDRYQRDQSD